MSELLVLSRADVAALMDYPAYVEAVEAGFRAAASGAALAPPASGFRVPGGSYHAKGAALLAGDPPVVAIKLNAESGRGHARTRVRDAGRDRRRPEAGARR